MTTFDTHIAPRGLPRPEAARDVLRMLILVALVPLAALALTFWGARGGDLPVAGTTPDWHGNVARSAPAR